MEKVIDPGSRKPFHYYQPHTVARTDLEDLLVEGFLRVVVSLTDVLRLLVKLNNTPWRRHPDAFTVLCDAVSLASVRAHHDVSRRMEHPYVYCERITSLPDLLILKCDRHANVFHGHQVAESIVYIVLGSIHRPRAICFPNGRAAFLGVSFCPVSTLFLGGIVALVAAVGFCRTADNPIGRPVCYRCRVPGFDIGPWGFFTLKVQWGAN